MAAIQHFFAIGVLPKQWKVTFVTLVPKVDNLTLLKDYALLACAISLTSSLLIFLLLV